MSQCDVTHEKSAQERPKQCLSGGCAMGAYLTFNATYLVSTATYYCKLSFNVFLTGQDHGDISLAGVWLHKEQSLHISSIIITPSVLWQKLQKNHCNSLLYHLYQFHVLLSSYMYIEVWKVDNHCNFSNNWSYAHVDLEIYPARIR